VTLQKIKVLVVDDSKFARSRIVRQLDADPRMTVVGQASNGKEALELVRELRPNVITLDVEMPVMDGITALRQIMRLRPTPVVMLSTLAGPQTDATIAALELGAVDFFLKSRLASGEGDDTGQGNLASVVRNAANAKVSRTLSRTTLQPDKPKAVENRRRIAPRMDYVVLIGSSTGGPKALAEVVPHLPADLNAAYLIVQHMPVGFTASLADRLNKASEIEVREAKAGDVITAGTALLAPGGFHMEIGNRNQIQLGEGPTECGVRPAIDVTARHAARVFGTKMRSVILTGMGSDGTEGSRAIKAAGGLVLAEHESTCAVYGMPKSVAEAGLTDRVAPLRRIANHIVEMCASVQKVAV